jgi:hypothetical protein
MTMKTHGHLGSTDPTDNREADMCVQIPSDLDFASDSASTSLTSDSTTTKSHDADVLTAAVTPLPLHERMACIEVAADVC